MAYAAGQVPKAADLPKGQVARALQSGTVTTSSTEAVALSATFTAIAGRRYRVTYDGAYQGTVNADILAIKFRWASGASVTTSGTAFRNKAVSVNTASGNTPLTVVGDVTGIPAGQATIGICIVRSSGTGNVSLNTDPGLNDGLLLIEDVLS